MSPRGVSIGKGDNKGIIYEREINSILKKKGLQEKSFKSAGAGGNLPDGHFYHQGEKYYIEIKLDTSADFGQLNIHHDGEKFVLPPEDDVNRFRLVIIEKSGFLRIINSVWINNPIKFSKKPSDITWNDKYWDQDNFKDIYENHDIEPIHRYYGAKNTHYMQIGKKGFYYLTENPANLPIPQLRGQIKLRARIKTNSNEKPSRYSFLIAFKLAEVNKSQYSLDSEDKFPPIVQDGEILDKKTNLLHYLKDKK